MARSESVQHPFGDSHAVSLELLRSLANTAAVPTVLLTASALQGYGSVLHWCLWFGGMAAYAAYVFLAGDWFLIGYPFRYGMLVGFALSFLYSSNSIPVLPAVRPIGMGEIVGMVFAAVFAPLAILALTGRECPAGGIGAAFPLRNGVYCVAEGGSNAIVNHHFPAGYARYAVDIVKLDRLGFRARGLAPRALTKYCAFGEQVYSPVAGTIVKAIDGNPDMTPPRQDRQHPAGNYVMIKHPPSGALILLAHLQRSSLLVREGDSVSDADPIGRVGNSGVSTEPHLHISCELDEVEEYNTRGTGIPLLFAGRFLSRNALVEAH
jgi:hypothetical protein